MAKKKTVASAGINEGESKVTPILEIGQSDPLFTMASHPTMPLLATGLVSGDVFCYRYDGYKLQEYVDSLCSAYLASAEADAGLYRVSQLKKKWWVHEKNNKAIGAGSPVQVAWKTKRHKGSCRLVVFDVLGSSVGEHLYSVGTDHIIKKAATETGRVVAKTDFSAHLGHTKGNAVTTMAVSSLNPFLLAGTEDGNIIVFDSARLASPELKFRCDAVHDDAVNKVLAMPDVSAYHYLSLGSTVLSHIDIRKGIITQSDDQSEELLSMCYPTDFMYGNKNDAVVVGHGSGILTLWKNSTNLFMDQLTRIKVNKNASIDALIAPMNVGDPDLLDSVWCGDSDGLLHRVNYKRAKVVETRSHMYLDSNSGMNDEVSGLDIDYDYRLISSGMDTLKIWSLQTEAAVKGDLGSDSGRHSDEDALDSDSEEGAFGASESDSGDDSDCSDTVAESDPHEDDPKERPESDCDEESDETDEDTHASDKNSKPKGLQYSKNFSNIKRRKININLPLEGAKESAKESPKSLEKKVKIKQTPKRMSDNGIVRFEGL